MAGAARVATREGIIHFNPRENDAQAPLNHASAHETGCLPDQASAPSSPSRRRVVQVLNLLESGTSSPERIRKMAGKIGELALTSRALFQEPVYDTVLPTRQDPRVVRYDTVLPPLRAPQPQPHETRPGHYDTAHPLFIDLNVPFIPDYPPIYEEIRNLDGTLSDTQLESRAQELAQRCATVITNKLDQHGASLFASVESPLLETLRTEIRDQLSDRIPRSYTFYERIKDVILQILSKNPLPPRALESVQQLMSKVADPKLIYRDACRQRPSAPPKESIYYTGGALGAAPPSRPVRDAQGYTEFVFPVEPARAPVKEEKRVITFEV